MITGDNPLTAAAIAQNHSVDDFLAQATPQDKMDLIKKEQADGKLVAMTTLPLLRKPMRDAIPALKLQRKPGTW